LKFRLFRQPHSYFKNRVDVSSGGFPGESLRLGAFVADFFATRTPGHEVTPGILTRQKSKIMLLYVLITELTLIKAPGPESIIQQ
jgi:hypothetical protein